MKPAVGIAFVFVCSALSAGELAQRGLSFDERVEAQTAIERVYYSHQLGTTKKFEAAVPPAVIEAKVHKYLEQSAALNAYWKTAVTDQALQRELERMAQGSRMPERLQELYTALGNDAFLIKECLVRPALVDRLTRNFYAFDSVLHAKERAQADVLHARLASGQLSPSADEPHRTVVDLSVSAENVGPAPPKSPAQTRFTADEFKKLRVDYPEHVGDVSIVKDSRDAFTISVVLSETKEGVRVANYVFPKTPWDVWWAEARLKVQGVAVTAVASAALPSDGDPALHPRLQKNRTSGTCADDYWDNGSLDDVVPGPRMSHVSVWTGTQMIVWGGGSDIQGFSLFQTGGRYDPATDTWTPTSVTGAPSPRMDATAIWTGHEMVIWGGQPSYYSQTQFNSGGRYDPVSDTWTPTTGRGAPGPRYTHSAVWTGSRMVIWGGYIHYVPGRPAYVWATGGQYDPATDSWTPTSLVGVPRARAGQSAVWTGQYMVIWGGNYLWDGGRYDPVNDRWLPMSDVNRPRGRVSHSTVWTGTEMIVWGGYSYFFDPGCDRGVCYREVDTGGRYDPVTDSWTATSNANAPTPRYEHRAVWTGSAMIVWGGGSQYDSVNTGGRYDPATDSWLPTSDTAPESRKYFTAVWTGQYMVVWGGTSDEYPYRTFSTGGRYDPLTDNWTPTATSGGTTGKSLSTVWTGNEVLGWPGWGLGNRYDPVADTWGFTSTTGAPAGINESSAVWTGTRMVVWGGNYYPGGLPFDTGGRYDPIADTWSSTSESGAPSARSSHSAVWTGSAMLIWGGRARNDGGSYQDLDTGARYDPESDTWTPMSQDAAPLAREQHAAVWTGNSMVIWGGGTVNSYGGLASRLNSGARYDPATNTWAETSTESAPTPRTGHSAVWTGNAMVVWGGDSDGARGTGGRYDPAIDRWTPTSMIAAPQSRKSHSAVWTGRLMVVWGGVPSYSNPIDDGGRYDPVTDRWSKTSSIGRPKARAYHSAVWTGSSMIVLGGTYSQDEWIGGGRYVPGTLMDDDCDGDGITSWDGDCDDHNPNVYPGAPQICDGINNDCNDPSWPYLPYGSSDVDADGDGFLACGDDCDDTNASVYPGAPQICDGVNDDCNDPAWPAVSPNEADNDHDYVRICQGDCDDTHASVGPGFPEYCDGLDNDCNGIVDDGGSAALCDDQNTCTDDKCIGEGGCQHTNSQAACDDGLDCTVNDSCISGVCAGTPTAGAACDAHEPCMNGGVCNRFGYCIGNNVCDDGDPCTLDVGDETNACACWHSSREGARCEYGYHCRTGDYCEDWDGTGTLTCGGGFPISCDDENPCTDDSCSPELVCLNIPRDGMACDDRNPCTQNDSCHGSICAGTTPMVCAGPCPAGSTPTEGGCAITYNIDANALDGFDQSCEGDPTQLYTCSRLLGFHWQDQGAIGQVLRVYVELASGYNNCSTGTSYARLNSWFYDFDWVSVDLPPSCPCPAAPTTVAVAFDAEYAGNHYFRSSDNSLGLETPGCAGLSPSKELGGYYARVTVTYQHLEGSCIVAGCYPQSGGCGYADRVNGSTCDDGDACTGSGTCASGNCSAGAPLNCDDGNPCTTDSCDPALGCVHTNNSDPCTDANACTVNDVCVGGTCQAGAARDCNDNNACTADSCDPISGMCNHGNPVVCPSPDQCHLGGACDPSTGSCVNTMKPDGTACDDGSLCTSGDACRSGICTPEHNGLNHPHPRTSGYYRLLCERAEHHQPPYQGDRITDADAVCVASIASTFDELRSAADVCAVLDDDNGRHGGRHHGCDGGPGTKECDKAEDELIATALNICRGRVCEAQNVDSRCGRDEHHVIETTAGASFDDANAILDDANRTRPTCQHARCELREINNGHALEMNSVVIARVPQGVRVSWQAMEVEDGNGAPDKYEIWRRPFDPSSGFVKIGETHGALSFVDTTAQRGAWEYEVTADIP